MSQGTPIKCLGIFAKISEAPPRLLCGMKGSRPVEPSLVGRTAQKALVVLSTVENSNDDNLGFPHLEHDRRSALKAHRPKALANVVPLPATIRKSREGEACHLDAVDISPCNRPAGLLSYIAVEREQISFRMRTKGDLILLHSPRQSHPRRDALARV